MVTTIAPERTDLNQTLSWHRVGGLDPTSLRQPGLFVKAFHTPVGPVTLEIRQSCGRWQLRAWGPGRDWLLDRRHLMLQPTDGDLPQDCGRVVWERHLSSRGMRVVRVPWIEDLLIAHILQQRVTTREAFGLYRRMARLRPAPAPGPYPLLMPPRPHRQATMAVLGRLGMDEKRAGTLLRVRWLESRLLRAVEHSLEEVRSWLRALPGVGPWTTELVMGLGMGDADALPTGDLHFPHIVSERLTGVGWSNDDQMVRLLEPYRPCRFRVLRLLLS